MEISDVRVRVVGDASERLKAVCSVTFDEVFVVRDLKIVEGTHGLFVAMPSRKLSAGCIKCRAQNHLRSRFCNECGAKLPSSQIPTDAKGREKAHRDIAHPIAPEFREAVQTRVLEAFQIECENMSDDDRVDKSTADDHLGTDIETAETDLDDDAQDGKVTEYGTLIADLKGGGGQRRERSDRPHQERGRQGGRSEDVPRRERSHRDDTPESEEKPVAAPKSESARRVDKPKPDEVKVATAPPVETHEAPSEDGFGAGLHDESPQPKPVSRPAEVKEVVIEEPVKVVKHANRTEAVADGDDAFGAGIL
jgi:DNA-binding cell septation regulator SpoVG